MQESTEHSRRDEKVALRARLRAARAALAPEDRAAQAIGLRRVVTAFLIAGRGPSSRGAAAGTEPPIEARGTIAAFLGVGSEPDTAPLLASLHTDGFDVVVPVCEPGHGLSWTAWWPGVPLARSAWAPVDEPTGPRSAFEDLRDVRMVLVPALGVDLSGARIGQGGGYYDRFLAQYRPDREGGAPVLAVVHRSEVLPSGSVPVDRFDQPLAGAFTPDGPLFFGPPRSRV